MRQYSLNGVFNFVCDKQGDIAKISELAPIFKENYFLVSREQNDPHTFFDNPSYAHLRVDSKFHKSQKIDPLSRKWAHLSPAHYTECHDDGQSTTILHVYFSLTGDINDVTLSRLSMGEKEVATFSKDQEKQVTASSLWARNKLDTLIRLRDEYSYEQHKIVLSMEKEFMSLPHERDKSNSLNLLSKMYQLSSQCDLYEFGETSKYTNALKKMTTRALARISPAACSSRNHFSVFNTYESSDDETQDTSELQTTSKPKSNEKREIAAENIKERLYSKIDKTLKLLAGEDDIIKQQTALHDLLIYSYDQNKLLSENKSLLKQVNQAISDYRSIDSQIWDIFLKGDIDNLTRICDYYGNQMPVRVCKIMMLFAEDAKRVSENDANISRSMRCIFQEVGISETILDISSYTIGDARIMVSFKEMLLYLDLVETFKVVQSYYPHAAIRAKHNFSTSALCWLEMQNYELTKFYIESGGPLWSADYSDRQINTNREVVCIGSEAPKKPYSDIIQRAMQSMDENPRVLVLLIYDIFLKQEVPKEESMALLKQCMGNIDTLHLMLTLAKLANQRIINTVFYIWLTPILSAHSSKSEILLERDSSVSNPTFMPESALFLNLSFYVTAENTEDCFYNWKELLNEIISELEQRGDMEEVMNNLWDKRELFLEVLDLYDLVKGILMTIIIFAKQKIKHNTELTLQEKLDLTKRVIHATGLKKDSNDKATPAKAMFMNQMEARNKEFRDRYRALLSLNIDNRLTK